MPNSFEWWMVVESPCLERWQSGVGASLCALL